MIFDEQLNDAPLLVLIVVYEVLASIAQLLTELVADSIITTVDVDPGSDCEGVFNQNNVFENTNGTISSG